MSIQFGPEYVRAIAPYQGGKPISEVAREFGLDARLGHTNNAGCLDLAPPPPGEGQG